RFMLDTPEIQMYCPIPNSTCIVTEHTRHAHTVKKQRFGVIRPFSQRLAYSLPNGLLGSRPHPGPQDPSSEAFLQTINLTPTCRSHYSATRRRMPSPL